MSDRERASILLESIPDYKIGLVIAYMEGLTAADNMPNEETIAATPLPPHLQSEKKVMS